MRIFIVLLCTAFAIHANSQVFPFDQGFHGLISTSLPGGWEGDMKVLAGHGLNDGKGMAADISSTDKVDSAITPWIGPLATYTEFYFWYRMVDDFIYPSTQKNIGPNDHFTIEISTDSINYIPIYTIDQSNHQPNLSFKRVTFSIANYGGETVKFKFRCLHGTGSGYYVDIDSIKVRVDTDPPLSIQTTQPSKPLSVYPNPLPQGHVLNLESAVTPTVDFIASIYSLEGRLLWQTTEPNASLTGTQHLQAGTYLIAIRNKDDVLVTKLLVQ